MQVGKLRKGAVKLSLGEFVTAGMITSPSISIASAQFTFENVHTVEKKIPK
jgi:hypothetical protein